jgi:VWFA-related protein
MKLLKSSSVILTLIVLLAAGAVTAGQSTSQQSTSQQSTSQQTQKKEETEQDDQDQPIKLGAALITVPFNVTDSKNRYINDLTKNDVDLLEDNKPQQIFSFERQSDLPITVAMLIDISGSQMFTLPQEKAAGQRFFAKVLRPGKDIGAVITFEHETVLEQALTPNVEKLVEALDRVRIGTPSTATIGGPTTPPINNSGAGATAIYDSIYAVSADLLTREAGRRAIILLTDGVDTYSKVKMRDAIERTWRSEIIVYCIGIGDRSWGGVNTGVLKKIAAETGGRAFFPRKTEELDEAFSLIEEDLRQQYTASYQPENVATDGSFRTIQMRVKNRKELTVRHRRGYFAPKAP